ncbi:D-ribose pyranase [Paenibacillus sp. CAU 1782]
MKKTGILNSEISTILSRMGHTDCIVICDCGLPIPDHVKRIDLALKQGTPSFAETLEAVLADMEVEEAVVASEMAERNGELREKVSSLLDDAEIQEVSHERFKQLTGQAKAVIRTGEATPYANIILKAGVIFG